MKQLKKQLKQFPGQLLGSYNLTVLVVLSPLAAVGRFALNVELVEPPLETLTALQLVMVTLALS